MEDAIEYSSRVGTKKWRCRGCDRIFFGGVDTKKWSCRGCNGIFWSSRYKEKEMSSMRKNIVVEWIRSNGVVEDAIE